MRRRVETGVGRCCVPHLRKELELAEAEEGARDTRANGAGLAPHDLPAVAVVPRAAHLLARRHNAERARRGQAERGHRLGGEELADRRAEHGAAVELPAERRDAGALELHLVPLNLADRDGATIAALPAVAAGEAGAVRGGPRLDLGRRRAAEHAHELLALHVHRLQAEGGRHLGGVRHQRGLGRGDRRPHPRVVGAEYLPAGVGWHRVGLRSELIEKRIVRTRSPAAQPRGGGRRRQRASPDRRPPRHAQGHDETRRQHLQAADQRIDQPASD